MLKEKDQRGRTPFRLAVESGRRNIVQMLLNHDRYLIRERGSFRTTPLHWATKKNLYEIMELLSQADPTLANLIDRFGKTPFDIAIKKEDSQSLNILIANRKNSHPLRKPYLFRAVDADSPLAINLLLNVGDSIGETIYTKETPLHHAANEGKIQALSALLSRATSKEIEATDLSQKTPLHSAASSKQPEAITLLLAHGANQFARDAFNRTPYMCAPPPVADLLTETISFEE